MLDSFVIIAAADDPGGFVARFGLDWRILVAQMINFLVVAFLLYRFAFKPILSTLDERQQKIADGLQYAEEMKSKLAETERLQAATLREANQEAQKIITDARDQAKALYDRQTAETAAKSEDMLRRAQETIARERDRVMEDVRREVARLVVATTRKVLARELDDRERNRLAESAARELTAGS